MENKSEADFYLSEYDNQNKNCKALKSAISVIADCSRNSLPIDCLIIAYEVEVRKRTITEIKLAQFGLQTAEQIDDALKHPFSI